MSRIQPSSIAWPSTDSRAMRATTWRMRSARLERRRARCCRAEAACEATFIPSPTLTASGTPWRRCSVGLASPLLGAVLDVVVDQEGVVEQLERGRGRHRACSRSRRRPGRSRCTARAGALALHGESRRASGRRGSPGSRARQLLDGEGSIKYVAVARASGRSTNPPYPAGCPRYVRSTEADTTRARPSRRRPACGDHRASSADEAVPQSILPRPRWRPCRPRHAGRRREGRARVVPLPSSGRSVDSRPDTTGGVERQLAQYRDVTY